MHIQTDFYRVPDGPQLVNSHRSDQNVLGLSRYQHEYFIITFVIISKSASRHKPQWVIKPMHTFPAGFNGANIVLVYSLHGHL